MSRIVVIDDDRSVREALRMVFKDGHDLRLCATGAEGLQTLRERPADLVFLDILLGAENGIDVLRQMRVLSDPPAVVMVTATRTVKTAVEAIKLGAFEYVTKPWDLDELKLVAQRAIEYQRQQQDLAELRRQVEQNKTRFTRELEEQVAARTQELEAMNRQLLETQDQLVRTEKLASLGELIAGVAHELNNKLSPILAYAQLLGEFEFEGPIPKYIQTMERSAEGASAVVQALLSFSRQSEPEGREVNLNEVLADTLILVAYQFKSGAVLLEQQLQPDLPTVVADDKQIGQVFLNILNNACQAMEGQGGLIQIKSWADDTSVCFTFRDSGPGISEGHLARIFDPFFTTKPVGKGTGLGLSVSYGIIKSHGGDVQVESRLGEGTCFHISLPRKSTTVVERAPAAAPEPQAVIQTGRVLVIDDDPDCRATLRDILSAHHQVEVVADAAEGRARLNSDPPYDAILLDCRMPGESGIALYEWLREHQQPTSERCVFITGDYSKPDIQAFFNTTGCPWIPKPFEVERVREIVAAHVTRP